jgi:aromatic ring-opening dioxygenase catalytic subunit (LigB family)
MATIVGSIGINHNPTFPAMFQRLGNDCDAARLFARARADLAALKSDLIVIFDTDHCNTFFLDNFPVFAIGVEDEFAGPNDEVPAMPRYQVRSNRAVAAHLRAEAVKAGFDLALVQAFEVDHSVIVPLHFVAPEMKTPVIPIYISGHAHCIKEHALPLPSARRCYALGEAVGSAIGRWPEPLRVVVVASGAVSLDVHGTKIDPGAMVGVPDPRWVERVHQHLERNTISDLLDEMTPEQLHRAGNVSGEFLNWVAMLGAAKRGAPAWTQLVTEEGYVYAAWH